MPPPLHGATSRRRSTLQAASSPCRHEPLPLHVLRRRCSTAPTATGVELHRAGISPTALEFFQFFEKLIPR
uniref:Uncharacterized protein n=1 Tax=Leersia perrieri TaxID=77586 RepID=A0A0D9XHF8_9ORYZ